MRRFIGVLVLIGGGCLGGAFAIAVPADQSTWRLVAVAGLAGISLTCAFLAGLFIGIEGDFVRKPQ